LTFEIRKETRASVYAMSENLASKNGFLKPFSKENFHICRLRVIQFKDRSFCCRQSMAWEQFADFLASYWHWTGWIQTTAADVLV